MLYDLPFYTGRNLYWKNLSFEKATVIKSNPERPILSFMSTRRNVTKFWSVFVENDTCSAHIGPYYTFRCKKSQSVHELWRNIAVIFRRSSSHTIETVPKSRSNSNESTIPLRGEKFIAVDYILVIFFQIDLKMEPSTGRRTYVRNNFP